MSTRRFRYPGQPTFGGGGGSVAFDEHVGVCRVSEGIGGPLAGDQSLPRVSPARADMTMDDRLNFEEQMESSDDVSAPQGQTCADLMSIQYLKPPGLCSVLRYVT